MKNQNNFIQESEVFFPLLLQKQIIQTYLSPTFPWHYINNVTFPKDFDDQKKIRENYSKFHKFVDAEAFTLRLNLEESRNNDLINNIKYYTYKNFNVKINDLVRIQFAFIPANPLHENEVTLFPHIDNLSPHKTLLYYVLDNDADTIFFNKKHEVDKPINFKDYFENVDIMHRVQPKQGKAVLFDGFIFHAGNVSRKTKRITLNVNFT